MKRIISVGMATLGAGGVLLTGVLPSTASTRVVASSTQSVSYGWRSFDCGGGFGCHAAAQLPKTWKRTELGAAKARFSDPARNRMVRFNTFVGGKVSTATAIKQKQAALKGTRGLKVAGTSTVVMKSTNGQGRLTVSTIVYTYRSGQTTRWVATRYIGQWGNKTADIEITTAGTPKDSKLLGAVINRATVSLGLAG
jgi:hypothetical protein